MEQLNLFDYAPEGGPEKEGGFEIFWYVGVKYYRCNQCTFNSYSRELLLEHIGSIHATRQVRREKAKPVKVVSSILGPDGEPLTLEIKDARFREDD